MKMMNPLSLAAVISSLFLAACTAPSNTLTFNPTAPTASTAFNTGNQKAIVSVVTKDERRQAEISAYTHEGQLHKLSSSPDVTALFQQIIQQDLNAKGFRLSNTQANTNLLVTVKEFYAKVDEGTIRHKITSRIQLEIHVQGAKGNYTKNMGSSRVDEGALGVNNQDIQKSLDATLKEVVKALYNDQEIANAIRQYAN
ncbi:YajG family lipoprotein [Bisgaard Taxon 10/6]|uniref:YajG family lipoprotein n=1 Tax=Exercitatus varius TaxID=67857 RepID=UPI00294B3BFD|nr:YajG family lipoprotein [Exercitatus varius]MDG2917478.1 YajG family lipoprotein [Exercitatus varius]